MAKTNNLIMVGVIGILAIAVILGVAMFAPGQASITTDEELQVKVQDVTACGDPSAPISFSAVNALNKGTSVTTTQTVKENGGNPAAAKANYPVGAELEVLYNATNFIDRVETYTVVCGGQELSTEIFATDAMTFKIFDDEGNVLTDSATGGAINQTIAAGGSKNLEIRIDGNDKQSSGDLIIVLEHTDTTDVSNLILSGLGGSEKVDVPDFYSTQAAGSKAFAYRVPAVVGAQTVSGTLAIQLKSGQAYSGAIYVTAYSEQAFADTDGSFQSGVEDSDDTIKYEDTFDYDFFVQ